MEQSKKDYISVNLRNNGPTFLKLIFHLYENFIYIMSEIISVMWTSDVILAMK